MQKRILSIAIVTVLFFSFFNLGCSKLDTTDIGSDLLPAVDNISTFETTLQINAAQGVFNIDTTKVSPTDDQVLGRINNDPLFGTTIANIFAQFKPTFFPYYYGNAGDTLIKFDSVVLCLSYKGFWGDSSQPLDLQVKEIPYLTGNNGMWDSLGFSNKINYAPTIGSTVLGSAQVNIASLNNYMVYTNHKDSSIRQIRIRLTGLESKFFNLDTNSLGVNSPFKSDSLFRAYSNGLAVIANGQGNGILYTNFTDSATKLEIHFKRKSVGSTVVDTTYSAFRVIPTLSTTTVSSTANNIIRVRPPQVANPASGEIYLQTSPGTFATLNIPALDTLSNRIIHRAEIIVEQIPSNPVSDAYFSAPNYLYIDLKDTGTTEKWKPIYYDLNPNTSYFPDVSTLFYPSGGADYAYFGGTAKNKTDAFGNAIKYYNFNITRYVQQIVTKHTNNYSMRLFAPYDIFYDQYSAVVPYGNMLANGRVKVGSGTNANYRMRLHIIYSKI